MKVKKIIISILFLILFICIGNCAYATTISFSNNSPKVGDSITITVSVPNVHTAKVYANVSGAGTSGMISVVGGDMMGNKTTLSNSITVKPTSAGTITVSVTDSSDAVADGEYVNVAASKSITVSEPTPVVTPTPTPEPTPTPTPAPTPEPKPNQEEKKSSNAILSYLGIEEPKECDFDGFSKNPTKTTWDAKKRVSNDVTRVFVKAIAGENGTVISGNGWHNIKEGKQALEIVVQSEDGKKQKTYKINIEREVASADLDNEEVPEIAGEEIASGLSKLEVTGVTFTPEFNTNEYKYTIEGKLENFQSVEEFKKLITTEANFEGAKIEITSEEENFKVGRNKILITVKDSDGREIAIYTIVLKLTETEKEEVVGKIEENKDIKEEKNNIEWNKIIVISAIVLMAIYSIVVSIIAYKQREILELNGLVEGKEEDDENYNPFEEIKNKEEKINIQENLQSRQIEESEEEIRRRKIDEFLRGRESKH